MVDPIDNLWVVLTAIAELVDDGTLTSTRAAIDQTVEMLGTDASDPYVRDAIRRLRASGDDLTFRVALGDEALQAMNHAVRQTEKKPDTD